jgi:multisubunit Na+/H+ antiporter MnhE subunit
MSKTFAVLLEVVDWLVNLAVAVGITWLAWTFVPPQFNPWVTIAAAVVLGGVWVWDTVYAASEVARAVRRWRLARKAGRS